MLGCSTCWEDSNNEERIFVLKGLLANRKKKNNVKSIMINMGRKSHQVCPEELEEIL